MAPAPSDHRAQAARLADSPDPVDPRAVEALLTDGCAAALHLEAELRRLQQRRIALASEEAAPLVAREREILAELDDLQGTIAGLYAARARTRPAGY